MGQDNEFWICTENLTKAILGLSIHFEGTKLDYVVKGVTCAGINTLNIPIEKFIKALHNTRHINIVDDRVHKTERGESFFKILTEAKK